MVPSCCAVLLILTFAFVTLIVYLCFCLSNAQDQNLPRILNLYYALSSSLRSLAPPFKLRSQTMSGGGNSAWPSSQHSSEHISQTGWHSSSNAYSKETKSLCQRKTWRLEATWTEMTWAKAILPNYLTKRVIIKDSAHTQLLAYTCS